MAPVYCFNRCWNSSTRTTTPRSSLTPKDQSLSLDALAERIEYETQDLVDVTLVAESFGGLVALALLKRAILKPQRIIFCVAFGDSPQPWVLKLANRLPIHYLPWHLVPRLGNKDLCR